MAYYDIAYNQIAFLHPFTWKCTTGFNVHALVHANSFTFLCLFECICVVHATWLPHALMSTPVSALILNGSLTFCATGYEGN